jgi:hypothetical protein
MNKTWKIALLILGFLSVILIVAQLVMALLILTDPASPRLRTMHQHSGYLMVAVALIYVGASLATIVSVKSRPEA